MTYAKSTSVSAAKTRDEIEELLTKYGATTYQFGWDERDGSTLAVIGFRLHDRFIKFFIEMPPKEQFRHTPSKRLRRHDTDTYRHWEQGCRAKWRSLFLSIKAKLVSIEDNIETFEEAFMAHIIMPDGHTVSQHATPLIAEAYSSGKMPRSLLALPEPSCAGSKIVEAEQ